jgi:predicted nucleic acid-binding protein
MTFCFKGACYGLLSEFVAAIPSEQCKVGILGAARFVIRAKLRRANDSEQATAIMNTINAFTAGAIVLEPTMEEARIAAEIEFLAQKEGLNLDAGESQLCAIAIGRKMSWMVTGDKQAIRAFEVLLDHQALLSNLAGRVICLEQLVRRTLTSQSAARIRGSVCRHANIDRSLAICFSCWDATIGSESWVEALRSYVNDLRKSAARILAI